MDFPPCGDSGGVIVTFDAGGTTSCDEPFTEAGVGMVFTPGPDCSGCSPSVAGGDAVLAPAMIRMDFAEVGCSVTRLEIDITDSNGAGTVMMMAVDMDGNMLGSATNEGTGSMETLSLEPGQEMEGGGIAGCDTAVHEVRLL